MPSETFIQSQIRAFLGSRSNIRLFRNHVGQAWVGTLVSNRNRIVTLKNAHKITHGLRPGSPDLVGWQTVTITPDMIGRQIGRFIGIEVKKPGEKPSAEQGNFLRQINNAGGRGIVLYSLEEAELFLEGMR